MNPRTPLRAQIFQHVAFEGPAHIGDWLRDAGARVARTALFDGEPLPALSGLDLLVVMGGPMSVNDEVRLPWLAAEKRFIRAAIDAGKAVLGICLGAQLIASALGARVYPNAQKEIGWFPVQAVAAPPDSTALFAFPPQALVFHWHGETFDLPAGAVRLARSAACENQAFQFGRRVIGLQFHVETTAESAAALVRHCRSELEPARFVQDEASLLAADVAQYRAIHALTDAVLKFLTAP